MKPFWVTFYSYKGGVGRSLALANTAALLVKRGRNVLLIDFDLEAPGLDSFGEFSAASGKPGVVEYVSEFISSGRAAEITSYVHECTLPGNLRGKLWVMPAGKKDSAYNRDLAHIDWADLYDSRCGAAFFENWKASVDSTYEPDYVFIDSRTGLTEIGGVCTTQFPDLVTMFFGLNDQNISGTATVAKSIAEAAAEKPPQIHLVASPIPNLPAEGALSSERKGSTSRRTQLAERLEKASEKLGVQVSAKVRYYPPAALSEKLFTLEDVFPPPPINDDYNELCRKIIEFNRSGLDFLLQQVDQSLRDGDRARTERLFAVLNRDYGHRIDVVFLNSKFALAMGLVERAEEYAALAHEMDPVYKPAVSFLVTHFTNTGRHTLADAVLARSLAARSRLTSLEVTDLLQTRGRLLMSTGRPGDAEGCFREAAELARMLDLPKSSLVALLFNAAEARRRAMRVVEGREWECVIKMFEDSGVAADVSLSIQANRFQAMHIAYALVGKPDGALEMLNKAERAASSVAEVEDIFSVDRYLEVSVTEFLSELKKMAESVKLGYLWDGMKLPSR